MFWKKKKNNIIVQNYNIYNLLNDELKRLHHFMMTAVNTYNPTEGSKSNNGTVAFQQIAAIHQKMDDLIVKMPDNELLASIKDIQNTVAELILLGEQAPESAKTDTK